MRLIPLAFAAALCVAAPAFGEEPFTLLVLKDAKGSGYFMAQGDAATGLLVEDGVETETPPELARRILAAAPPPPAPPAPPRAPGAEAGGGDTVVVERKARIVADLNVDGAVVDFSATANADDGALAFSLAPDGRGVLARLGDLERFLIGSGRDGGGVVSIKATDEDGARVAVDAANDRTRVRIDNADEARALEFVDGLEDVSDAAKQRLRDVFDLSPS